MLQPNVIVIVWRWEDGISNRLTALKDTWTTKDGDILYRFDKFGDAPPLQTLFDACRDHAKNDAKILYFLHTSGRHKFNESDCAAIQSMFGDKRKNVRIRLFGDANGPLYYGQNHKFGLLGFEYNFPTKLMGFEIDNDKGLISATNFQFVWNYYWQSPRQSIFRLAENFCIHAMGFPENENTDLRAYLQSEPQIWYELVNFGDSYRSVFETSDTNEEKVESDLTGYLDYLYRNGNVDAANNLKIANQLIHEITDPAIEIENPKHTISQVYDLLRKLFISLPESTL